MAWQGLAKTKGGEDHNLIWVRKQYKEGIIRKEGSFAERILAFE